MLIDVAALDIESEIIVVQSPGGITGRPWEVLFLMDVLTLSFVGLLLIAALFLTLNVRRQILRAAEVRRLREHQLGDEMRRRNVMQGNPRSATRSKP